VTRDSIPIEATRLVNGFRAFQMVAAACRLNLPDLVVNGPKNATELAAATGTNQLAMHKLLRGLTACRVFVEKADGCFAATDISDAFRTDKPGVRNLTLMLSEESYDVWADLMYTLQTGKPAYQHVRGKGRWEELAEKPAAAVQFNAAMVEITRAVSGAFIAGYDFKGARTVVDVGGGTGALLASVLKSHPHMKGTLFDLPAGLAEAREAMSSAGLEGRVTFVEGSFFESVPSGGDVYLLKSIIHDWDDDHAEAILKTCRAAMEPLSRLVLLERVMPERVNDPDRDFTNVISDLHMMILFGGQERTPTEYGRLLSGAGLTLARQIAMESVFGAFEAVPS
jgi:hypothetical protein